MPNWKGIVGKSFAPKDFPAYVESVPFGTWRPQFVVLHNTGEPTLADWHKAPGQTRMANLENYYKNVQQWSAGPHLFVADDLIWVFTPLNVPGVHSPSWNSVAWGVEMVGDYATEAFSPPVRENTLSALAAMHGTLGLDPERLRMHKEDPRTTHVCPGANVVKGEIVNALKERLSGFEIKAEADVLEEIRDEMGRARSGGSHPFLVKNTRKGWSSRGRSHESAAELRSAI